jgi:hypothetical protein
MCESMPVTIGTVFFAVVLVVIVVVMLTVTIGVIMGPVHRSPFVYAVVLHVVL